jgi:hypothetical protein
MPSLKDMLSKTMLFTAAAPADPYASKLAAGDPINIPTPTFSASTQAEQRAIWHFAHDPSAPAKITGLTALVRPPLPNGAADPAAGAMAMTVCTRIEALSVTVQPGWAPDPISLPLTKDFVVAKFFLQAGHIPGQVPVNAGNTQPTSTPPGWWRLETNTDVSILVVFAYELVQASGTDPNKVPLGSLENAGAFPSPGNDDTDPDWLDPGQIPQPPAAGDPGDPKTIETTVTVVPPAPWVIVAFSLTTCKERADFEPGEVLGAGRVYPHVMVLSNQGLQKVEAKIAVDRPAAEAMKHDPEMMDTIGAILVADTNEQRNLFSFTPAPPLPVWSNFFDYWDTSPPTGVEFKMVDPTRTGKRTVSGAIQRERSSATTRALNGIYESSSDFVKFASQGAYDNLHLAPRMKFTSPNPGGPVIPNIAMAPFCVHDCFHTHTRWGTIAGSLPVSDQGFNGRIPNAISGAVLVPADQTVFIKLTNTGSTVGFEYRAVQGGSIQPSRWSVFYHHGSAYAIEVVSPFTVGLARTGVQELVKHFDEPFTSLLTSPMSTSTVTIIDDVKPIDSWAAFYQRLQFTGEAPSTTWQPRIKILDLAKCQNG